MTEVKEKTTVTELPITALRPFEEHPYKVVDNEEMQNLVDLGWPLVRLINRWFTLYVFDWLTGFGLNMGIVLIIICVLLWLGRIYRLRESNA